MADKDHYSTEFGFPVHKIYQGNDCIYQAICGENLDNATEEHIFNSSWNGRVGVHDIIGAKCNNEFSSSLDTSFDPMVTRIKNVRGLITERKNNAPPVYLPEGKKLRVHAELSTPGATHSDSFDAISNDEFDFDLKMQYRSTAHTCLKALAYYTPELARSAIFRVLKEFIKNGVGNLDEFAVEAEVNDTFLPTKGQFLRGESNHIVLYFSKRLNKVIGVFTLLGVVRRSIILANEWNKDEFVITVAESEDKGISSRCWFFPDINNGLPSIININSLPDETTFKESELVIIKKFVGAMSLSYKQTKYLEKLDNDKILLTCKELDSIKRKAIELCCGSLDRTGNSFFDEQITQRAEGSELNSLLEEYKGKFMDRAFAIRLRKIEQGILTSFDPRLSDLE